MFHEALRATEAIRSRKPLRKWRAIRVESSNWSERAILALEGTVGHERDAMRLHAASGDGVIV
jgi:hypothetical protein